MKTHLYVLGWGLIFFAGAVVFGCTNRQDEQADKCGCQTTSHIIQDTPYIDSTPTAEEDAEASSTQTTKKKDSVVIDRVTFLVKDMDRAKERFARIFNIKIAEGTQPGGDGEEGIKLIDQGVRAAASVPNGRIELISVVDLDKFKKTAKTNKLVKELNHEFIALLEQGYEGPVTFWLKVADCKESAEELEGKGVNVNVYREGGHPGLVPRYQEAFLNWSDLPVSGINLVSRNPAE